MSIVDSFENSHHNSPISVQVVDLTIGRTDVEWRPDLHMALYEQIKEVECIVEKIVP